MLVDEFMGKITLPIDALLTASTSPLCNTCSTDAIEQNAGARIDCD